jgi:hypothetical protein
MSDDGIVGALTRTVSGAADMLTCASPRKAGFVPDAPLGAEPEKKEAKEEAKEEEEDMSFGDRALSMFGGKPKKKAEAKSPKASKGDDDEMGFGERALSMFGGAPKKGGAGGLPPNWKKAKDKDGKVYYFNSVTQVRQYTEPRALPKGWTEALHKESGRVYYVHKATRKTTFSFPQESEGDAEDAEEKKEEDGMIGKTLSFATGGMLGGKKKKDADLGRTGTMTKKAGDGAKKEGGGTKETTVFISCTTLIKEVKLCVDASKHPPLDALLDNLVNHKIAAEEAVKNLQTLVGTTLVQQAVRESRARLSARRHLATPLLASQRTPDAAPIPIVHPTPRRGCRSRMQRRACCRTAGSSTATSARGAPTSTTCTRRRRRGTSRRRTTSPRRPRPPRSSRARRATVPPPRTRRTST